MTGVTLLLLTMTMKKMKTMPEVGEGIDPYVQDQILARLQPAVVKIEFLSFRSKHPAGLVFAVEGDDDKIVYSYWIARLRPELRYEFFVCRGKRGVRSLRNSLAKDLSQADADLLFLVDRDFDDLAGFRSTERVFMLDRYSVENYLVERSVVDECLKIAFPGHGDATVRSTVCDLFERQYAGFLRESKPLNQQIFVLRRLGADIDEKIPDSLACIAEVDLVTVQGSRASVAELMPIDAEVSSDLMNELRREFEKLDPALRYRGKYALKFLRVWLTHLVAEFRNAQLGLFPPSEQIASKVKHEELSLGALASRSPLPDGFVAFLETTKACSD